jgi:NitT/TauT family transport system substrate-binding protein
VRSAPPADVAGRLQSLFPGTAPAALTEGIAACQRLGCWDGEPTIDPAHYEVALDVFQHSGLISRRYPFADMVVAAPDAR